ncbi:2Fe-2S iron-sulfur cluster-binding protein, partial [Paracoccaceae bacterium]|nr:2Fe-2S iron-sulfur cluster-binding protein [Paracoccaceae bacterium]
MRNSAHPITNKQKLSFTFNGKKYFGHKGDTLASALIANNIKIVGRSFKYHRPRGIFSAGSEEPNALVEIGEGPFKEPNTKATNVELFDGLKASSQNFLGSINYDLMAVNDLLKNFIGAGFYYKTFMWPQKLWEKIYEPVIRNAAGLGKLSMEPDPSHYDKGYLHSDFLIVGSGISGLMSALLLAETGSEILVIEEDFILGGRLNSESLIINGEKSLVWVDRAVKKLRNFKNVRLLTRTAVYAAFDHGIFAALEKKTDHMSVKDSKPRQINWKIYTKHCILASGAIERSIAFPQNDRPGIMLSGSVRTYANRFGAHYGQKIAVYTNNDDGWKTAYDLKDIGLEVKAIIDTRKDINVPSSSIPSYLGQTIKKTYGRKGIKAIKLSSGKNLNVDCLAVSGGWSSNIHLTCHKRGKPIWDNNYKNFLPADSGEKDNITPIGAAKGIFEIQNIILDTNRLILSLIKKLGLRTAKPIELSCSEEHYGCSLDLVSPSDPSNSFIDLQNDVTQKDIELSVKEGFKSVEHLKRYSTLGMATDQGKTSNILGLASMAKLEKTHISEVGTTIFRPPYVPIAISAFAGRARGENFRPTRLTPSHNSALRRKAVFVEAGNWLRVQWFPEKGETFWRQSVDREVLQTRNSVGICDVTTLGKIDIQGKDSSKFLNFVYTNAFARLPINRVRYGLMLREDGVAYDDGTTARLGENHFIMTTTTANAALVFRNLEFARQCLLPNLDVHLISTTDSWAQYSVAGPNSRKLLQKIVDKPKEITNEKFPFMACREMTVCGGVIARLFRISFSGELAFEVAVPRQYGNALFNVLISEGKEFNAIPYGTEALG